VNAARTTQPDQTLSIGQKTAYGAVQFSDAVYGFGINLYLLFFFSTVIKVEPSKVGIAMAVGKIWDAFTDPVMGHISDRTNSRFGRRRPYMVAGGILLAFTLVLLWGPPSWVKPTNGFGYVLILYLAYSTFYTILMIPYAALGAELTPYYDERTSLFAWSSGLGAAGGVLAALLWTSIVEHRAEDPRGAFATVGTMCAAVVIVTVLITTSCTRERYGAANRSAHVGMIGLMRALWDTLRNGPFRVLFIVFIIAAIGIMMVLALLKFIADYWLRGNPSFTTIALINATVTLIGIPFVGSFAKAVGKRRAYLATLAAAALCLAASFVMLQPGMSFLVWCWTSLFALCSAGLIVLPRAILPDIIDEDELVSDERREGLYSGMLTFAVKLSAALGIFLAGIGLDVAGFSADAPQQTEGALMTLRIGFGIVPAALLAACFGVFLKFPITKARAEATRQELERRCGTKLPEKLS
jgi:sugar (glycoside-pentoside-hexuronide) transporter